MSEPQSPQFEIFTQYHGRIKVGWPIEDPRLDEKNFIICLLVAARKAKRSTFSDVTSIQFDGFPFFENSCREYDVAIHHFSVHFNGDVHTVLDYSPHSGPVLYPALYIHHDLFRAIRELYLRSKKYYEYKVSKAKETCSLTAAEWAVVYSKLETKLKARDAELEAADKELETANEELKALKAKVEKLDTLGAADALSAAKKCDALAAELEACQTKQKESDVRIEELQTELAQSQEKIVNTRVMLVAQEKELAHRVRELHALYLSQHRNEVARALDEAKREIAVGKKAFEFLAPSMPEAIRSARRTRLEAEEERLKRAKTVAETGQIEKLVVLLTNELGRDILGLLNAVDR